MKKTKIKIKDGGYAILFTVVIVGIISLITIGLSNSAYKQTILSSVAKDSTAAFYQADIGSECALFIDREYQNNMTEASSFSCGDKFMIFGEPDTSESGTTSYKFILDAGVSNSNTKCFRLDINKVDNGTNLTTEIISRGYNICNKNNFRTVERGLKVTY